LNHENERAASNFLTSFFAKCHGDDSKGQTKMDRRLNGSAGKYREFFGCLFFGLSMVLLVEKTRSPFSVFL
jgi:hypothetical protein